MYFIYYIRWIGTYTGFEKYLNRVKKITDEIDEVEFKGAFAPSSDWNFAFLFNISSFDKGMEIYRTYIKKFEGQNPQELVGKLELLFTLEEIGLQNFIE